MGVTLGAGQRESKPGGAGGRHAIHHRVEPVLERVDASLLVEHRVAVEPRGDALLEGRLRQHVSGDLLDREAIERHVRVQSIDDPVAIRPDRPLPVFLVAVGVSVARQVQPAPRPSFPIPGRGQQAVHQALVGVRRRIVHERVRLLRGGRDANQVQANPPHQRVAIRRGRGLEAFLLQPGQHESVDRVAHPATVFHARWSRLPRRHKRPMRLVIRSRGDPIPQHALLFFAERILDLGRRHHILRARGQDAAHQFAFVGTARRDHGGAGLGRPQRLLAHIETELRPARAVVGPMALEAVPRQDGANLAREIGLPGGRPLGRGGGGCGGAAEAGRRKQNAAKTR